MKLSSQHAQYLIEGCRRWFEPHGSGWRSCDRLTDEDLLTHNGAARGNGEQYQTTDAGKAALREFLDWPEDIFTAWIRRGGPLCDVCHLPMRPMKAAFGLNPCSHEWPNLVHLSRQPFVAACGADRPNQRTTTIRKNVTCLVCLNLDQPATPINSPAEINGCG